MSWTKRNGIICDLCGKFCRPFDEWIIYGCADPDLLKKEGFEVKDLNNGYQIRINGVLDVYPVSRSYHDIKNNKRGGYNRNRILADFVKKFFNPH